MPNIKPISDLRNYTEVLQDVAAGAPVFLTKNGRGRYAIVDIQDYEKAQATLKLMSGLAKGRRSGETEGYLTPEDMRAHFHARLSSGSFSGYEHEAGRLKVTAAVPILEPLRFSYHILNPSGAGWAF